MTPRNIHGEWSMSFENRFLHVESFGATNRELGIAQMNELQKHLESSSEKYSTPWVILNDYRRWQLASQDAWETYNSIVTWMSEHNCVFLAFVITNQMQNFALEKGLHTDEILQFFFDYNKAYQTCLDKLSEAQWQQQP
ncbi:hypothetical protein L4C34_19945 [Vibrio profundum]|uniref:hypothetical protein n=1 Tax=Vibrio profundum TaxID=2910247 RepID=UPI003D138954